MTLLIIIPMILTLSLVGNHHLTLEVLDSSLQRQNKVTFASIKKQCDIIHH